MISGQLSVISGQWSVGMPLGGRGSRRAEGAWISRTELVLGGPGGTNSGAFVRGPSASCKWVVRGVTFWRVVQRGGNRMPASTGETAAPQITKGFWCEGQNKQAY